MVDEALEDGRINFAEKGQVLKRFFKLFAICESIQHLPSPMVVL
jgi:hypothetical protein